MQNINHAAASASHYNERRKQVYQCGKCCCKTKTAIYSQLTSSFLSNKKDTSNRSRIRGALQRATAENKRLSFASLKFKPKQIDNIKCANEIAKSNSSLEWPPFDRPREAATRLGQPERALHQKEESSPLFCFSQSSALINISTCLP